MIDIIARDNMRYDLIPLGRKGENLARRVVFDLSDLIAEFGEGEFAFVVQRAGETIAYPALNTERDGNNAILNLTSTETAISGNGNLELRYYVDEVLCKTILWRTNITPSIGGGTVPDPIEEYVETMRELMEDTVEAAEAAAGSASDASDSASAASRDAGLANGSAEAAAGSANAAEGFASSANTDALKSEGYAVGKQNGEAVASGSPYYHNNAGYYAANANESAGAASGSATSANADAMKAEGFAVGEQNGAAVASGSPYYQNNAEYYADQAAASAAASAAMTGLAPAFDSTKSYAAGEWVIQSGKLYEFTAAHAAGAWTGSDAVERPLSDEVVDLKNQIANAVLVDEDGYFYVNTEDE